MQGLCPPLTHSRLIAGVGDIMIPGAHAYEWLPGQYYLLHRVAVMIGGDPLPSVELIGLDAAGEDYFTYAYGLRGNLNEMQGQPYVPAAPSAKWGRYYQA